MALEACGAGVWSWDAASNEIAADARYRDLYGFGADEIITSAAWQQRLHPADREQLVQRVAESLREGEQWREEFRIRHPALGVRWIEGYGHVRRDAAGRLLGLIGINLDVTDRDRANVALRQSEARHRALLSAIPDLIFLLNAEGVLLDIHAPEPRLLLVPPEGAVGKALQEVLPPPALRAVRRALDLALLSAEAPSFEYELTMGSELRQFEGRAVACDHDQVIVITRDVTAGKRAEEALRQAQKLESLEALAGGIAHDFNNILSAILGQASLGLGRLSLDSPARPHVIKVIDATERAADIARKMLDYSGHGSVQTRHSDLNRVVEESRSLLEAALPKHVILGWELAPGLPRVRVDAGQVQHALANLALNAVEAGGGEGPRGHTPSRSPPSRPLLEVRGRPFPGSPWVLEVETGPDRPLPRPSRALLHHQGVRPSWPWS
jgi:PAS domain S-box-containing protein